MSEGSTTTIIPITGFDLKVAQPMLSTLQCNYEMKSYEQ